MARRVFTQAEIDQIRTYRSNHSQRDTAKHFDIGTGSVSNILHGNIKSAKDIDVSEVQESKKIRTEFKDNTGTLDLDLSYEKDKGQPRWLDIKNPESLLKECDVDTTVWEVASARVSTSEVTMRLRKYNPKTHIPADDVPVTYTNVHVSVSLKRKCPKTQALQTLLDDIRNEKSIFLPIISPKISKSIPKRHLEIDILDPHLGLRCYQPGADVSWTPEEGIALVLDMVQRLIIAAKPYGPFEGIIWPFGNDFLHADNVFHTTTQGTEQPESDAWQYIYQQGCKLCLTIIELLRKEAPEIFVYSVPGNHDRQSVFTMAQLMDAVYAKEKHVHVDASASPYKFHHYGVNLIGFEHGHSIRQTVRLAALMANECRDVWGQTCYREWHLGDQHRKGSAKPSMHEEQGVSVEYLAGLTPPNEWHKLKGFNHQKRAASAFIWDKEEGPIARLQVNINSYTGRIMGH